MFKNLFQSKVALKDSGVFDNYTEWHCHLLPGVDDGVQKMEESLKLLALYEKLGVKEVWFTPHIMEDVPNEPAKLKMRLAELQAQYQGGIRLHLAAENMMDNLFEKRLADGNVLPLGEEQDHLLVETSYFNPPMGLYDILRRVQSKGYFPVLAHPERYQYMREEDYKKLKDMGVKFQLNVFSLVGAYGPTVQKKALIFLKKSYYDFRGTDTHRYSQFRYFIEKKITKDTQRRLLDI